MRKRLTNNLLLKIISVIAAIIIWLVVTNVNDPTTTYTISSIPITVLNEQSAIIDNGLTYELVDNPTASVQVTVRKNSRSKVSADNFTATIDLNEIYAPTSHVEVSITPVDDSGLIRSWTQITRSVEVKVEEMQTREFEIQVIQDGEPEDGVSYDDAVVTPDKVTVTAPESIMENISYAGITVDVDGASDDIETSGRVILYMASGRAADVSDERVSVDVTEASLYMTAKKSNQIAVDIRVTGQDRLAEGYKYINYTCNIQSIMVRGSKALISEYDRLTITEDLSGASGDVTRRYSVSDYLPEGLVVTDGNEIIEVTYLIEQIVQRSFETDADEVGIIGSEDGFEYELNDGDAITIILEGLSEDLDSIEADDIAVSVDVSGITAEGEYIREAVVTLPDEYASYFKVQDITVSVSVIPGEEEAGSEDDADSE